MQHQYKINTKTIKTNQYKIITQSIQSIQSVTSIENQYKINTNHYKINAQPKNKKHQNQCNINIKQIHKSIKINK